ncbi:MAG: hypothetical protein WCT30_01100 [Desulfurivibrionaceae bacterium]|jgi:hypothetical protein
MRCPKCGYISFDRQRSCSKCSTDLTAADEQIQGTGGKAAAPFFLGAVLGKKTSSYDDESAPDLQEEETLALDEFETEALPADEEDLDFAGAPLDDDGLEDQSLPSLGLEDIDVSDLVQPQEEEEELVLSLGNEEEETAQPPAQDENEEEAPLSGIEFSGFDSGGALSVDEKETALDDLDDTTFPAQASAEDDEIIDLSSLMNFEEEEPADKKEDQSELELSLGDEPESLHLDLEDDEKAPAAKKPETATGIPDLDLTLENDDQ